MKPGTYDYNYVMKTCQEKNNISFDKARNIEYSINKGQGCTSWQRKNQIITSTIKNSSV